MWSIAAAILNPYTQIKKSKARRRHKRMDAFDDLIHLLRRNREKLTPQHIEQLTNIIKEVVHEK